MNHTKPTLQDNLWATWAKSSNKHSFYAYARRRSKRILPSAICIMICRRHGLVHHYKRGCPRCSAIKHFYRPLNLNALRAGHKRRDRRGPSKPQPRA